ncbi:ATP-binding protein [Candidatus Daviesbacteria bacterium]|nr:ATP-binding protein [Candidatus Daviesbacteria bacterium]
MKEPMQYLLVGFPYSGKTILAKKPEKRLGFARINIDELKFKRGYTKVGDDDVPDKVWDEIFKEADELIVKYLSEGKNLVNEYAWMTREWRERARKVAKKAGFQTKIIYLDIPLEVVKERWKENQKSKKRFDWPEHEFKNYINDFEELTEDEDFIVYDPTQPITIWIDRNLT